jgi:DNA-binding MurR/RpiR family transcriptional regulator
MEREPRFALHPLQNVLSAVSQMPESCRTVARYILDNPRRVASFSIGELARLTRSNKTAVVRVCKLSGYRGYRELRAALLENRGLVRGAELLGFDIPPDADVSDDRLHVAREVIKINLEVLQETLTLLDKAALESSVDRILAARHVFLTGFGSSAPVAQDTYQRFLRLQIPSSACADPHILASIAANLSPSDLLLSVTYSGETRDIIEALETARRRHHRDDHSDQRSALIGSSSFGCRPAVGGQPEGPGRRNGGLAGGPAGRRRRHHRDHRAEKESGAPWR